MSFIIIIPNFGKQVEVTGAGEEYEYAVSLS